jgi:large subunit ribosomal protein L15
MTSKKRRQRGSRTHGGGSHKNRRGAGHRGGRGAAGRDKHEFHNHPPLGKSGFTRPEKAKETVETIDVRELDEDAPLLAAEGIAKNTENGYLIDVQEIVDPPQYVDTVKVLGAGQVRNELVIIADDFSKSAIEKIESAGGEALSKDKKENITEITMSEDLKEVIEEKRGVVEEGGELSDEEIDKILELSEETGDIEPVQSLLTEYYDQRPNLEPDDVLNLYQLQDISEKYGQSVPEIENLIEDYFNDVSMSQSLFEDITEDISEEITYSEAREILSEREEKIRMADEQAFGKGRDETQDKLVAEAQKNYLYLVREKLTAGV